MIPRFSLYGEPPRDVDPAFVHVEDIAERSGPAHGRIQPHVHSGFCHIFLITHGSGLARCEGESREFTAPAVLILPAGAVHGFTFSDDIKGYVVTFAVSYGDDLARAFGLVDLWSAFAVLPLPPGRELAQLVRGARNLRRELQWQETMHRAAVAAHLCNLVVSVGRIRASAGGHDAAGGPGHMLVTKFRELVEGDFKTGLPLSDYVRRLRVSDRQLRYACEKIAGQTPMRIIIERRLMEARRQLLYSGMSVADIAQYVGFDDPAYFSRLFTRAMGASPRAYRAAGRS